MTDINSLIKTEDLDNISDNELYQIDKEESNSSESQSESDSSNSDNESEYEDSDSSVEFHDLDQEAMNDLDDVIKSKNEILNEPIPDIENIKDIKINLENQKYMKLGKVYKKITSLNKIIIESDISGNEYIIDISKAILFKVKDDETKVVGLISEIFGPITKPYYTVSFKPEDLEIFNDVELRDSIYILIDDNFKLIKTSNIKLLKGSDASNFNDEEVLDEKDIEFSDDEKEREWKKQQKNKKNNNAHKIEKGYVSRSSRNANSTNSVLDEKNIKDLDVNKLKMILGPAVVKNQVTTKPAPKPVNDIKPESTEQQELIQKLNSLPKEELLNLITQMNNQNQPLPLQQPQMPYQQQMQYQPQFGYPGYNMGYANQQNMYPYMMQQYQQYPQQGQLPQQFTQQQYPQGHMPLQFQQPYMQQGNMQSQQQGQLQMNQLQGPPQMNNHQQNGNNGKSGYTFGQGLNQR